MAFERREYVGSAAASTLASDLTDVGLNISGVALGGWPTGGTGPFYVTIGRGTTNEEKIKVTSRSGNVLTVSVVGNRGADGTTASVHTAGESVEHTITAVDMDEANRHYADIALDHHTQYLNNARHDIAARHTFGAAYGNPSAPLSIATVAATGSGDNPSREDHVHIIGTGAINGAGMFAAGAVDAAALATNAVTTVKITDANVTAAKLASDAVTTVKILDANVTAAKIGSGAVTLAKFGSGLQPVQVCTSGTRPTPTVGMTIFETDTGLLLTYQSATTGWTKPWGDAWGEIDYKTAIVDQGSIGTSDVDLTSLTVTATVVANRKVRVTLDAFGEAGAAAITLVGVIKKDGTQIQQKNAFVSSNAAHGHIGCTVRDLPAAGSHTWKAAAHAGSSTMTLKGSATAPAVFLVEDIGPNGAPV